MSIFVTGQNIYMRQGDTGNITFSGLPKDKAYTVYLSVYNPDENTILKELVAASFTQATGVAIFTFNEDFSNSLPVGDWIYGLKICANDGSEDTILPQTSIKDGKLVQSAAPTFTVDYKVVEGE